MCRKEIKKISGVKASLRPSHHLLFCINCREHYLILPQFSPLLMRYMVISETPNCSANFLMVIFRFLSPRIFLMPLTCLAFSFRPSVLFACTFLYAILAGLC